ncbi:MAG TPA: R3H domain-containing nucleic acid-binding protein [Kineosporiaceae bacterium]
MSETDVAGSAEVTEQGAAGAAATPSTGVGSVAVDEAPSGRTTVDDSVDDLGDQVPEDVDDDDEDDDDDEGEPETRPARAGRRGSASLKRLEEEGEVAADYLEELLDITDLDGDIDIDVENGRPSVAIVAEAAGDRELRRLVGARGEVLEALQELSRLAVQARTGERSRLMLDVAGFRAGRKRALEDVAARACQDVQRSGQAVRLEPMSAFERKVVHDVVAAAGLRSESEGEDPGRRVVVHPTSS